MVLGLLAASNAHGQGAVLMKLGSLYPSGNLTVSAINTSGNVLGISTTDAKGDTANVIFVHDVATNLGNPLSTVTSFNNSNTLAGSINVSGGIIHVATYSSGVVTDLGSQGGSFGFGYGINNSGEVTGYTYKSGNINAFLYNGTSISNIGPNTGIGVAINDAGQIAGTFTNSGNHSEAFLYDGSSITHLGMLSGDNYSSPSGINSLGDIVGVSGVVNTTTSLDGFLYTAGSMSNLGHLGTGTKLTPTAINSSGTIVGSGTIDPSGTQTDAFIFWGGALFDLNTFLGSSVLTAGGFQYLNNAIGINDNGLIIGTGYDLNGNLIGFELVPEPGASAILAGAGVLAVAGWRRRRSKNSAPGPSQS